MAKVTVGLPQGTRDFGPDVVRKRNYILNTIRNVFELYGFQPLETPAMENMETLMGKYGDEGDKLIFKILNNGLNDPKNIDKAKAAFEHVLQGKNDKNLTERALRYDLTIPFARYVAMNQGQLTFPFKRYQIQPVWRADRPQKGRYREFYQCDADVVGSNSLINEVELAIIYLSVFEKLQIVDCRLQINSRKILKGIMEVCGVEIYEKKILIIIDKTDKIGTEGVEKELKKEDIAIEKLEKLLEVYSFEGTIEEKILFLKRFLESSPVGLAGTKELEFIITHSEIRNLQSKINIDLSLARGLDYYTGIIFEVKAPQSVQMGSIGGGGRYDDLTGLFGVPGIPGVGISFGVDRIYDVMEELKLFPEDVHTGTQVLFFNLGENESKTAFSYTQQLRSKNIRCELFHEQAKMDKQFKYAEKKNIPYAVIIGEKEWQEGTCNIKDLRNGIQQTISQTELVNHVFG
ncbi:MAG: histidine--tRNA ligase [Chitinophagaceae bacterium]|nr:histidine--tRNA ligase [Chitinophagaceae bacterium]